MKKLFLAYSLVFILVYACGFGTAQAATSPHWTTWSTEKGPHTTRFDGYISDPFMAFVHYGTTIKMDQIALSKNKKKDQSVFLTNLQPNTTYYYILGVEDSYGNRFIADEASNFVTSQEGKPEVTEKQVDPAGTVPLTFTFDIPGPAYLPTRDLSTALGKIPKINRIDLSVSSDSASATCAITTSAAIDDWGAAQIEYGLAADKQPFQEIFNWGFSSPWCKKAATLGGLFPGTPTFFRVFANHRDGANGIDVQAYSKPVSFLSPEKGGSSRNISFSDIDAPSLSDFVLYPDTQSAKIKFKSSRPTFVRGSYGTKPAVSGEHYNSDISIPKTGFFLDHALEFSGLKEYSIYPITLWIEDVEGAGIFLSFNLKTRGKDSILDDTSSFDFQSLRQDVYNPNDIQNHTVPRGGKVKLEWSGSSSTCEAFGAWNGTKLGIGSEIVNPESTAIYELRCIVKGIERRREILLTVIDASTFPPPLPLPQAAGFNGHFPPGFFPGKPNMMGGERFIPSPEQLLERKKSAEKIRERNKKLAKKPKKKATTQIQKKTAPSKSRARKK